MATINTSSIVQERNELDAICADLGLKDIKYLPSPKQQNGNISDLTKHATLMLKIYKQHIDGDSNAPIKEIFTEE
jgi:hypothetical protein